MKNSEYRRLSRSELLEMLIASKKENERLKKELALLRADAEKRRIRISEAGTMAEAAMSLNEVYRAADDAAEQYLENMRLMEAETRARCDRMLREAEMKTKRLSAESGERSDT